MKVNKCIWCDGEGRLLQDEIDHEKKYEIKCQKCGFVLVGFDTKKEAKLEWNGMINTADLREIFIHNQNTRLNGLK